MSRLLFFSGAGLSADSGLATFRDSNGLWDKYDPQVVCNFSNWNENYDLVHEFYNARRVEYRNALPNKMHKLMADIQLKLGVDNVEIITQNIDNLLEQAGATNVMHIHGHINYIHCLKCGKEFHIIDEFQGMICDKCTHSKFKPSIVFFGENAPKYQDMYTSFAKLTEDDILIVIGTNGNVIPISSIASQVPAKKILCNLEKSEYINENVFDHIFYKRAEEAIEDIGAILKL